MDKYFASFKVEYLIDKGDLVEIKFTNGQRRIMPKKTFDLVCTDSPSTFDHVEKIKFETMAKEIIQIILSYDIQLIETNRLIGYITNELQGRFNRAQNYLWTKDDSKYIAGFDPTSFFTILEAERIIAEIKKPDDGKQNTSGVTS